MKKLRIAFVSPPHADYQTPPNLTWLLLQSHYNHFGKYSEKIEFIRAPYKFDKYSTCQEIKDEMDLGIPADVYMFGSYVWNYEMCDDIALLVKQQNPNAILVIGGPQIGKNEPDLISKRLEIYDYICQITKPGEAFFNSLIDGYFDNLNAWPKQEDVVWEWRSNKKEVILFPSYSVYEEHFDYLKEVSSYADENGMEHDMPLESTRGCPYSCTFCEWGGGIGGKVYKKDIDVWKKDIIALKAANYDIGYLCDANFGILKDRDLELFEWTFLQGFSLVDISTFKDKSLEKRKTFTDSIYDILGKDKKQGNTKKIEPEKKRVGRGVKLLPFSNAPDQELYPEESNIGYDGDMVYVSRAPTVSIQSVSEDAMKIAKRADLSLEDKIKLSEHINQRCAKEGYPKPALELILGMPGSTKEDFYKEYEIYWNFQTFGSWRHEYMFLPDSELTNPSYIEKYKIEMVECFTDAIEEGGMDNRCNLYKNYKRRFKTIASCFSFTREDMHEMFFMNIAGNILLEKHYQKFEQIYTPSKFCETCYEIIRDNIPEFKKVHKNIIDIMDPNTPTRTLKNLVGDKSRIDCIMDLITGDKEIIVLNGLFEKAYAA